MSLVEKSDQVSEFIFTWRIENFILSLISKSQDIESPVFRIKELQNTEWKLSLCVACNCEKYINLNLHRNNTDQGPPEITISGKLFVARNNDSHLFMEKRGHSFKPAFEYMDPLTLCEKAFQQNRNNFLLKDTLTVGYHFFIDSEDPLPTITECSARTRLKLKKYSLVLPLNLKFTKVFSNWDYSALSLPTASTSTDYPEFNIGLKYDHDKKSDTVITITIRLTHSLHIAGIFQCKLSFSNEEEIKYEYKTHHVYYETACDEYVINISKDTFNENSLFNVTHLTCEISASERSYSSVLEETVYKYKIQEHSFEYWGNENCIQNLNKMYIEKSLCDFKVIVSKKKIPVHKTVLAAVSPVFRAMFESGMTETEKSQVVIKEFSVEAVEKMLEFSYSGNVKDLSWNNTFELYRIADKYQIEKLKRMCSSFFKSTVCVETVTDLLSLADLHSDAILSEVARDYIFGNSKAVFRSDGWKQFMEKNLEVASGIMYRFCKFY